MTDAIRLPRGVRNFNAGNIDYTGIKWDGLRADNPSDGRFCIFTAPEYGIRAIAMLLRAYQNGHGLHTVRLMIERWAPPSENVTATYANFVAEKMGVRPDEAIDVNNIATLRSMVVAIIAYENAGYAYPEELIDRGIAMAMNAPSSGVNLHKQFSL